MASGSSSQGRHGKETTEELLARLNLQEEEDDDFVWEEELPDLGAPAKWLAIARVHTTRTFSPNALYGDMRAAWNPAKTVVWRKVKDNLFTAQFGCLGDWNKAMLEGPWLFRDQAVILVEYDGFKNPDSIKLDKLAVWAQIHRLPDNFLIEPAVRGMASRIGEVEEVQLKLPAGFFGEFVRVRVKIDINAKIKRFVTGKKGDERVRYQVKYEKLPVFCFNCGECGHWHEECGDGVHDETKFEWGDFVLADNIRFRQPGRGGFGNQRGRGGPRNAGGRGRGREQYNPNQSWRFNAYQNEPRREAGRQDEGEDNAMTTEVSGPSEPKGMIEEPTAATLGVVVASNKRQSSDKNHPETVQSSDDGEGDVVPVSSTALVISGKPDGVPPMPPIYVSPRKEVKRRKKDVGNKGALFKELSDAGTPSMVTDGVERGKDQYDGSAGSSKECRRTQ